MTKEELRVLKERQGGRRLRFTNEQHCRLAAIASIVTPVTLLRWHRQLITKNYHSSLVRRPDRPRKPQESRDLVIQMAQANLLCG